VTEPKPVLRVVKGNPSDEETAALVVAVSAVWAARTRAGRPHSAGTGVTGTWASHARALRVPPAPSPGAWRRSALPG
jgi:acyl-CoA carboxylase epsilon subunit-like protein